MRFLYILAIVLISISSITASDVDNQKNSDVKSEDEIAKSMESDHDHMFEGDKDIIETDEEIKEDIVIEIPNIEVPLKEKNAESEM